MKVTAMSRASTICAQSLGATSSANFKPYVMTRRQGDGEADTQKRKLYICALDTQKYTSLIQRHILKPFEPVCPAQFAILFFEGTPAHTTYRHLSVTFSLTFCFDPALSIHIVFAVMPISRLYPQKLEEMAQPPRKSSKQGFTK